MKTASKRRAVTKPKRPATVEEYFARIPEPGHKRLKELRAAIRAVVPAETTEVISYGIPAFRHKRVLVWFAAFADHCSLFPTAEVIDEFKDELKGYSTSKGTVHFPLDKRVPAALVKKMVKVRVARESR